MKRKKSFALKLRNREHVSSISRYFIRNASIVYRQFNFSVNRTQLRNSKINFLEWKMFFIFFLFLAKIFSNLEIYLFFRSSIGEVQAVKELLLGEQDRAGCLLSLLRYLNRNEMR